VVPEDPPVAVHHPLVAAHLMVGVVAHHPSVNDHRHSVTAHHLMVAVAAAHPLAAGTGNLHKITQITSENAL
jgi:hypothetical protein